MNRGSYLSLHLDRIPTKEITVLKSMLSLLNSRMKYQWQTSDLAEHCLARMSYSDNKKIFTFSNNLRDQTLTLDYPLRAMKLMEALDQLGYEAQGLAKPSPKALKDKSAPSFIERLHYRVKQKAAFNICHRGELHMTVLPKEGLCYSYTNLSITSALDVKDFTIHPLVNLSVLDEEKVTHNIDHILWQFAVMDGGSSLLRKISMNARLQLKTWPDFGVIDCKGQAIQLTARLVQTSMSLTELKELLDGDFDYQDLSILISALYLMGLLEIKQSDTKSRTVSVKIKNSLMNRIRRTLGI